MIESVTATLLKAQNSDYNRNRNQSMYKTCLDNLPHNYNAVTEAAGVPGEDIEPEDVLEAAEVERYEQHWHYKFP